MSRPRRQVGALGSPNTAGAGRLLPPPFGQKGIWTAPFAQREVFEKFCWCRNKAYIKSWRLSVSSDRLSVDRMKRLQVPAIKHFCGAWSSCAALFRNNKLKQIINELFERGLNQALNWQTHPNMLFCGWFGRACGGDRGYRFPEFLREWMRRAGRGRFIEDVLGGRAWHEPQSRHSQWMWECFSRKF